MKPRVVVFGWPRCYPIIHGAVDGSPFRFIFAGGCADFMKLSPAKVRLLRNVDAVILHSVGPPPSATVAPHALDLLGGKAKVALWSMDCHNPGTFELERQWASQFDAWFVAHSEWMPLIQGKVRWMPCYLPATKSYLNRELLNEAKTEVASVCMSYSNRDLVINRFKSYMDTLGTRYFVGMSLKEDIAGIYVSSKTVLNVNQNSDLNIRQFEALAAGRPVLMTPAFDWKNPAFADLQPYAVTISRNSNFEEFKDGLGKTSAIDARPARNIVLANHQLIHRYEAISRILLP